MEKFTTIAQESTSLFKDRGSKFLGYSFCLHSIEDAKNALKKIKEEHPKATHHCYAYRLGVDKNNFRANDDGEPSGSAGKPILGQIDSLQLTNVLVIVVRYYGGTLLGVPGLINAYKTATIEVLQTSGRVEKWICKNVSIEFDYPQMSEVLYQLQKCEAEIWQQDLQLFCIVKARVPNVYLKQLQLKYKEHQSVKLQVHES